jgi:hypothetical protein
VGLVDADLKFLMQFHGLAWKGELGGLARLAHAMQQRILRLFAAIALKWLGNRPFQTSAAGEKMGNVTWKLGKIVGAMGKTAEKLGVPAGPLGTAMPPVGTGAFTGERRQENGDRRRPIEDGH